MTKRDNAKEEMFLLFYYIRRFLRIKADYKLLPSDAGNFPNWSLPSLSTVRTEIQRQLEDQVKNLDRILQRAQILFTTEVAFVTLNFKTARMLWKPKNLELLGQLPRIFLGISGAFLLISFLGAAAILTIEKRFGVVDVKPLSSAPDPGEHSLTRAMVDALSYSKRANAEELTVFRVSVYLFLLSAIFEMASWITFSNIH